MKRLRKRQSSGLEKVGHEHGNALERKEKGEEVNRQFSPIPWPDDKYLGGVCKKTNKAENEIDDEPSQEGMHGLLEASWRLEVE